MSRKISNGSKFINPSISEDLAHDEVELSVFKMQPKIVESKNWENSNFLTKNVGNSENQSIIAIQPSPLKSAHFKTQKMKSLEETQNLKISECESDDTDSFDSDECFKKDEFHIYPEENCLMRSFTSLNLLLPRASKSDVLQFIAGAVEFHLRTIADGPIKGNGEVQVVDSEGYPLLDAWPDVDLCRKVWRLEARGKAVLNAHEPLTLCFGGQSNSTVYDWRGDFFGALVPGPSAWQIISTDRKVIARIVPCMDQSSVVTTVNLAPAPTDPPSAVFHDQPILSFAQEQIPSSNQRTSVPIFDKQPQKIYCSAGKMALPGQLNASSPQMEPNLHNPISMDPTSFLDSTKNRSKIDENSSNVYCIDAEHFPTPQTSMSKLQGPPYGNPGASRSTNSTDGVFSYGKHRKLTCATRNQNFASLSMGRITNRWVCILEDEPNSQIATLENKTNIKFSPGVGLHLKLLIFLAFIRLAGQNLAVGDLIDVIKFTFMCCSNND